MHMEYDKHETAMTWNQDDCFGFFLVWFVLGVFYLLRLGELRRAGVRRGGERGGRGGGGEGREGEPGSVHLWTSELN